MTALIVSMIILYLKSRKAGRVAAQPAFAKNSK